MEWYVMTSVNINGLSRLSLDVFVLVGSAFVRFHILLPVRNPYRTTRVSEMIKTSKSYSTVLHSGSYGFRYDVQIYTFRMLVHSPVFVGTPPPPPPLIV